MNYILLLGAGFSRNWGGWLAQEAFEYLLGCPTVDEGIRALLWRCQRQGGFEAALAELQEEHRRRNNPITEGNLKKLQDAIIGMFRDMDSGYGRVDFEFDLNNFVQRDPVKTFLGLFDAIFTLNQDLLLERYYLNRRGAWQRRWRGQSLPGMTEISGTDADPTIPNLCSMRPSGQAIAAASPGVQPFIKLHGSSNWIDDRGTPLLVMGGNKISAIEGHAVLKQYHQYFENCLAKTNTRLMVIGYSFQDGHINSAISIAGDKPGFGLFIIDPLGSDVIDENRNAMLHTPGWLAGKLQSHVIGASRRSLREIFGSDKIEHEKVMRFFSSETPGGE